MNIGILGSGVVGQTLGGKLAEVGNDVVLGTRSPGELAQKRGHGNSSLQDWLGRAGKRGRVDSFAAAAAHGEVVFNATGGTVSLDALQMAGAERLEGKILIDVSNPLDFSKGMPPTLSICNDDSLGEQIQRAFPRIKVVKALNTMTTALMVDPQLVGGGDHHVFMCGDDAAAKAQVTAWLREWFGWREVIDVGGIDAARGTEMILPLWLRLWGALGTPLFNFRIVR